MMWCAESFELLNSIFGETSDKSGCNINFASTSASRVKTELYLIEGISKMVFLLKQAIILLTHWSPSKTSGGMHHKPKQRTSGLHITSLASRRLYWTWILFFWCLCSLRVFKDLSYSPSLLIGSWLLLSTINTVTVLQKSFYYKKNSSRAAIDISEIPCISLTEPTWIP